MLAANRDFYRAFAARDYNAMAELWAEEHAVACIHPGWAALHGRDGVLESWRAILGSPQAPDVTCSDPTVVMLGDAAFVTCVEHVGTTQVAATNVFVLEQGKWRMVHHHAGPMAISRPSQRSPVSSLN